LDLNLRLFGRGIKKELIFSLKVEQRDSLCSEEKWRENYPYFQTLCYRKKKTPGGAI